MAFVVIFFHSFQFLSRREGNSKKVALVFEKKKKVMESIKQKEATLLFIQNLTQTPLGKRVYESFEKVHPSTNLFEIV